MYKITINIDLHMDARAMEFEDGSFDGAIDKGTLDAILVWLKSIL